MFLTLVLFLASLAPFSTHAQEPVYRCGNSYSATPCKGGRLVEDKTSIAPSSNAGPGQRLIYLCKSHGGGLFWSSHPCQQQQAFLERTEAVPAPMRWEQQVAQAQAQWDNARALTRPAPHRPGLAAAHAPNAKNPLCAQLEHRVQTLDSMGRAGSQYYDLDWVRRERKAARDQQARLKC
ncbi:hypothetical protein [Pantoea sp. 18069]|uniref:hypothetical protein n=1 Tax=Pantoea sp. 18069 TaxID=2681415 RepID=UPI001357FA65|nr:hypothetical protein [Pantoea sp. 18069]